MEHEYGQIGDLRMHWVSAGAGERTVVLLHGWPQTWYQWRHLIPVLAEQYRVIAPDLRGWGETERPAAGFDAGTVAADVGRLLDHLGVTEADVIGHDWGVPVGYLLAASDRQRIRSLVLSEASIPGAGGEELLNFSRSWNPLWFFPFLATPDLPQQLLEGRQDEFFTWILQHMTATPEALTDADLAVYLDAYRDPDALRTTCGYYAETWTTAEQVRTAAATPLDIPVLSVGGELSLGATMLTFVERLAPKAEGVVVPGSAHLIPEESPAEFADLVTRFLAKS